MLSLRDNLFLTLSLPKWTPTVQKAISKYMIQLSIRTIQPNIGKDFREKWPGQSTVEPVLGRLGSRSKNLFLYEKKVNKMHVLSACLFVIPVSFFATLSVTLNAREFNASCSTPTIDVVKLRKHEI